MNLTPALSLVGLGWGLGSGQALRIGWQERLGPKLYTEFMDVRFLADVNVVKLARWLRVLGYDAKVMPGADDNRLIAVALKEGRVLLTRDTQIMARRVVTLGIVKAILVQDDDPKQQLRQVVTGLGLDYDFGPFTRCLECNQPLADRTKEEVKELVPPYVFRTQAEFRQCPLCKRVYWRGTHWQKMNRELEQWQATANPSTGSTGQRL